MKSFLRILFALTPIWAFSQTANVTKTPGTNLIKEDLVFGTGRTLTGNSGSIVHLGNATVTWPTTGQISDQGGTLAAQRNALAPAQALSFSGTAGATITNATIIGSGDFTARARVFVATLTVADQTIFGGAGTGGHFTFWINQAGTLQSVAAGVGANSVSSGVVTAGLWADCAYVRSGTTGTYYLNGVSAGTTTDSRNYASATSLLGEFGGGLKFAGILSGVVIENRALSAAEVLSLYQTSAVAAGDIYGSGVNTTITSGTFVVGKKYRILVVGTTDFTLIGASASSIGVEFTATGVGTGTGTATALGALIALEANAPGNGSVWNDVSGNGAHQLLPATGVNWSLGTNAPNVIRSISSTSGNQQLYGANCIAANTRISAIYARSRTGTPSIKYGTTSAGNELGTVTAISTNWTSIPLGATTTTTAAASIWINSTTTDVVETNFITSPLGF